VNVRFDLLLVAVVVLNGIVHLVCHGRIHIVFGILIRVAGSSCFTRPEIVGFASLLLFCSLALVEHHFVDVFH